MPHRGSWPERGSASLTRQAGCIREGHLIRFFAVFGVVECSEPAVLRAESPGCDSLGCSARRAAPGPLARFRVPSSGFRVPIQPGTRNPEPGTPIPYAEPSDGLSGLVASVVSFDLGLRSRTRFSPGCDRTGFQPSTTPDKRKDHTGALLLPHFNENSEEPPSTGPSIITVLVSVLT